MDMFVWYPDRNILDPGVDRTSPISNLLDTFSIHGNWMLHIPWVQGCVLPVWTFMNSMVLKAALWSHVVHNNIIYHTWNNYRSVWKWSAWKSNGWYGWSSLPQHFLMMLDRLGVSPYQSPIFGQLIQHYQHWLKENQQKAPCLRNKHR